MPCLQLGEPEAMGLSWLGIAGWATSVLLSGALFYVSTRRFHSHEWVVEGVLKDGTVIEMCPECGTRRVFEVREGKRIRLHYVKEKNWEKVVGKISPQNDGGNAPRAISGEILAGPGEEGSEDDGRPEESWVRGLDVGKGRSGPKDRGGSRAVQILDRV